MTKATPRNSSVSVSPIDDAFSAMMKEVRLRATLAGGPHGGHFEDPNAYSLSRMDRLLYLLENLMAASKWTRFYVLIVAIFFILLLFSLLTLAIQLKFPEKERWDVWTCFYFICQVIVSAGWDPLFVFPTFEASLYLGALTAGLLVFAVLIGFVSESVAEVFVDINRGTSTIAESGHTLILGWNESTARVVCQIAFLRRAWHVQNETWGRRLFPWRRVAPSTPAATNRIVVLCNTKTKEEMDNLLAEALAARGISKKRTRVGWDLVCRIGNPADPHDLLRAGAHRAASVLCMVTDQDRDEERNTGGVIRGGATLTTMLALRHVMLKYPRSPGEWKDFRCVVQLDGSSMRHLEGARFVNDRGDQVVHLVDLRAFLNTLMFNCISQPGMSLLFMDLLDFDGFSFRSESAVQLGLVGKTFGECRLLYRDAVVVGVVDERRRLEPTRPEPDHGLACRSARVITEQDRVVLVSQHTNPQPYTGPRPPPLLGALRPPASKPYDVLVCGWREEWSDGKRLAARAQGLTRALANGSRLEFLNLLSAEDFAARLAAAGFDRHGPDWLLHGVRLVHTHGDAADPDTIETVLRRNCFEAAIVMGTIPGLDLAPESRDRRVLTTMILLRDIHQGVHGCEAPLHVVGENSVDVTSMLAVAPRSKLLVPDFVNTQAINARVLVQALAYPYMQAAIAQLFYQCPGSPQLLLLPVGPGLLAGAVSFAQVTETLRNQRPSDVLLGLLTAEGAVEFAPDPGREREYTDGDKLVLLTREEGEAL